MNEFQNHISAMPNLQIEIPDDPVTEDEFEDFKENQEIQRGRDFSPSYSKEVKQKHNVNDNLSQRENSKQSIIRVNNKLLEMSGGYQGSQGIDNSRMLTSRDMSSLMSNEEFVVRDRGM